MLGSQALRPPVMMSTKPIKSASRAVPSHAGRYSQNSVTRYWSLEINYHTAPNNERTALPILQKIISVPLRLLGSAEYIGCFLYYSQYMCYIRGYMLVTACEKNSWENPAEHGYSNI